MPSRCYEFVDSRLRRSPPDRASAVPYGQAGENATRFPRLAHRSAAAHKLHSTPQQDGINLISGNHQTSSRLPAFSLFLPGSCPNNRDHRLDLESQLAAVELEDCQIIRRSLDRDFPFGRALGATAIFRAVPVTEDGFDALQIERRAAAVDQRLKHLLHVAAGLEDQVPAVFDLIVGVLVAKPAALLFVEVEREAHTSVNPTLADLAQSPYSPMLGQGVCDPGQTCGVRDACKAVSLLRKDDAGFACLAGDIFMAVQDHLGRERRMAADLDRQMAPLPVNDVERVVVDVWDWFLSFDVMVGADIPHRRFCATDQHEKQAVRDLGVGEILFGQLVLTLSCRTVDYGNALRLGVTAHATAEPAGQTHQVGVLERLVRSRQRPPPHTEAAGIMPHREKSVENDAVDAIVAAAQQILVESTQPVAHGGQVRRSYHRLQTAPQGPLFRSRVWEKA